MAYATIERAKKVAKEKFPGATVELAMEKGKIVGTLITEEFKDMDYWDRVRVFKERIWGSLGVEGRNVEPWLLLAPGESGD
jgi:hypothetical protein